MEWFSWWWPGRSIEIIGASKIKLPKHIPKEYFCPITNSIMSDPVTIYETKQTYERQAILKLFQKCESVGIDFTDPMM